MRRRLLFALGMLLLTETVFAQATLLDHKIAGSAGGNTVSVTLSCTGAKLITVFIGAATGTLTTPSDGTNTYTALTKQDNSVVAGQWFYAANPTGGSLTITYTQSSSFPGIAAQCWSSVPTSTPFDHENGNNGAGLTSIQPGSVTPTSGTDIAVVGIVYSHLDTMAINSSFSAVDEVDYLTAGNNFGVAVAWKNSSTAENPTWSWGTSAGASAPIAAFKTSAAAPTVAHGLLLLGFGGRR